VNILEELTKLKNQKNNLMEQLQRVQQQLQIIQQNIIRIDGAMGFLNDQAKKEVEELEKKKGKKK